MKKLLALLLALVLAAGALPSAVLAADSPSPGFLQRVGVLKEAPEGYIEIRTADDLRPFQQLHPRAYRHLPLARSGGTVSAEA